MDIIQRRIDKFDAFQRKHPFIGFPFAVIKKYGDDEAGKQAALLAYYSFLSLFPLLLVLTTTLKLFLRNESELQQKILAQVGQYFPPSIGMSLQPSHGLHGAGLALVLGILLTLFGARGVADIFRGAVNLVWEVPVVKRTGFPMAIIKSLGIIIIGGVGLLAAPVFSAFIVSVGHNLLFRLAGLVATVLILFLVFLFLLHMALSVSRPLKQLRLGAFVAAVGLTILQVAGSLLLKNHLSNLNGLYAPFALSLGLLYWLYLQAQVLMYAFEIDTVRVMKLAPRSVNQKDLTKQDRAAFRLYAHRNRFHDDEEIDVRSKNIAPKRPLLKRLRDAVDDLTETPSD